MLALLIPISVQDVKKGQVCIVWIAIWGLLGTGGHLLLEHWELTALLTAFCPGLLLLLIGWISHGIGMGDGFLFLAIGGICGGADCFRLLTESMLLCMAGGVVYHLLRRKGWKERMPLVPFVLAAFAGELVSYLLCGSLSV